ncbi:MAG: hypothetical protein CSA76_05360 [Spirochaetales bacterium]|nr:MAG: hypothetical protein CSA76_05360 [Spirochaetales bacterium]
MSTTPLIFNPSDAGPYTVVGGGLLDKSVQDRPGLSIILLNRGNRQFRSDLFEELCKLGAYEVISLESAPCPYDVEPLVKRHERLRFMIFSRQSSDGARIDAAMREALSSHVFVIRGDLSLSAAGISSRVFSKIAERGCLCTVPVFYDSSGELLPTALYPAVINRTEFETAVVLPPEGQTSTLAPWDFCGIYRRKAHQALGGFDASIREPWWQKLDYGLRAWLWGEKIRTHSALKMEYVGSVPAEDASAGPGYRRFFLKNLGVHMRGGSASLPLGSWRAYRRSSGDSASSARAEWKEIQQWVRNNKLRFTCDVKALSAFWDWEEEV